MAGLPSSCNGISACLQNAQYLIFQLDTFEGVRSVLSELSACRVIKSN